MDYFKNPICSLLLFVGCALLLMLASRSGLAQTIAPEMNQSGPEIPPHLLYPFRNDSGETIAEGQFVKLEGNTVTIRLANHRLDTLKLSNVDEEGNEWVRKQVALQKKNEIKAAEAREIVLAANTSQPRTIVKACAKLKPLGRAAAGVTDNVKAFLSTRDPKAKLACLTIYPRICELEMESLTYLTELINQNKLDAYDVAMDRPEEFLESIATMDYLGLLYLRHVAFNCNLKTDPEWISQLGKPIELKFTDGTKNELRRAAIKAIGEMKSEEAASLLVDMSRIVEEPINGKQNDKTLAALINSLGNNGVSNGEVLAVLRRHEHDFPDEYAKAMEKLTVK